jgi:hypothetical protein
MICRIILLLALTLSLSGQMQPTVKFGGKVYIHFTSASPSGGKGATVNVKKYLSDVKVILVQRYYAGEVTAIERAKKSFCNNDRRLLAQYQAKVVYTNSNGYFEFSGLQRQTNYVLIFCDREMQISEVSTGSRYATYVIRDKLIKL